jgi:cytoskeleton protein RodZ
MFEIGNSLREARTRRGVEFAQAEQTTKIRGKYLRALEEDRFDVLPSETYVKGFLRTYADFLGLDGQLYVDEYNSRYVTGEDWQPRAQRSSYRQKRERRLQANVVLIALAAIALVTIVVITAWSSSGNGAKSPHAARTPAAPRKAAVVAGLVITAVGGPSKVIVNRTGARGRILFEGTLERGHAQTFSGTTFWLNLGSPENLVIKVAGKRVHIAGYRPWVLTVTPTGWHGHPA